MADHSWKSKIANAFSFLSDKKASKKNSLAPGGQIIEVDGAAMSYTQILTNSSGEEIIPLKQGTNRDAARIGVIARTCGA